MKQLYDEFKEYISLLIIYIYGIGYLNFKVYYYKFNIAIENYSTVGDYLFLAINLLIQCLMVWSMIEIISYPFSKIPNSRLKAKAEKIANSTLKQRYVAIYETRTNREKHLIGIFIGLVAVFFVPYISKYLNQSTLTIVILYYGSYFYFKLAIATRATGYQHMFKDIFIMLLIVIAFGSIVAAVVGGNTVHTRENREIIEFESEGISYSTNDGQYYYIGETSQYLFILDVKCEESRVFFKENLSNYKVLKVKPFYPKDDKKIINTFKNLFQ